MGLLCLSNVFGFTFVMVGMVGLLSVFLLYFVMGGEGCCVWGGPKGCLIESHATFTCHKNADLLGGIQ